MKKTIYLLTITALLLACKPEANQLILTGKNLSSTDSIYLYDLAAGEAIDTLAIVDGQFTCTQEITGEPKLLFLTDNALLMHYFIAEKGKLTLDGDDGFITGSPLNKRLAKVRKTYRDVGKDLERKKTDLIENAEENGGDLTEAQIMELQKLEQAQSAQTAEALKKFYNKDKNTILGVFELLLLQGVLDYHQFIALYEQGGETVRNFPPFVKYLAAKKNAETIVVGAHCVDFEGVDPQDTGKTLRLSDYTGKGKYVLLDFWASWCGPCKESMPKIKALNDKYGKKGLQVIGVVVADKLDAHLQAAKELNITWPQIFDDQNAIPTLYGISGVPTLILLDKDGVILLRSHDSSEAIETLTHLLKS